MMKKQHSSSDAGVFGEDSKTERYSDGYSFVLVGFGESTGSFRERVLTS